MSVIRLRTRAALLIWGGWLLVTGAAFSFGQGIIHPYYSVALAPAIGALLRGVDVRAVAHITGGGLPGNLARVLPGDCDAVLRRQAWEVPQIFHEIQRLGRVDDDEMAHVFNLGIGMVVAVPSGDAFRAIDLLRSHGHRATEIGLVEPGAGAVRLV